MKVYKDKHTEAKTLADFKQIGKDGFRQIASSSDLETAASVSEVAWGKGGRHKILEILLFFMGLVNLISFF